MAANGESSDAYPFIEVSTLQIEDAMICPICLDEFDVNNSQTLVTLSCSHQFHPDCIGTHFNYKRRRECPICCEVENRRWICSGSPNGGGDLDNTLDGAGHGYIVDVMPLACIWDSLDEPIELLQMMSEPDYYYSDPLSMGTSIPPSAGVLPLDAPFLLCPLLDDLHIQDEYFPQDIHRTIMTIRRVCDTVGSGTVDEASAGESIWDAQSFTSEGGWGDSLD